MDMCVCEGVGAALPFPSPVSSSRRVESILYCYPSQVVTWKWTLLNLHQMAWELMRCLDSELKYQASRRVN
jgi:hypothetical protein